MSVSKIEEQLDQSFSFLHKILETEKIDIDLFAISLTLFHYYTYYKTFKTYDKFKLMISCLFLAGKIKGIFIKLDRLRELYRKYSQRDNEISDKDIMSFELDLLIFLGFEVEVETSFYFLSRLFKKINLTKLITTSNSKILEKITDKNLNNELNLTSGKSSEFNNTDCQNNSLSLKEKNNTENSLNNSNEENKYKIVNNTKELNNKSITISNNNNTTTHLITTITKQINPNLNSVINTNSHKTKIIDSNNIMNNKSFGGILVTNLGLEYFNTLSTEELADKLVILSYNFLCDIYRRPFCIVFKPKCIALATFLITFNLLIDKENSEYFLDLKYFFNNYYEEGNYKDFIICYSEISNYLLK
jgi:hypothetical protein